MPLSFSESHLRKVLFGHFRKLLFERLILKISHLCLTLGCFHQLINAADSSRQIRQRSQNIISFDCTKYA